MRGSISKRESGSYRVRWHVGERRYRSKSFRTKKEAEKFLSRIIDETHQGTYRDIKPASFEAFALKWLEAHGSSIRESTIKTYQVVINHHLVPFFGRTPLVVIGPDDVLKLLSQKKNLAPATRNKIYTILSKMLSHAIRWGYLKLNPCKEVDPPRIPRKEMSFLTLEESQKLLLWLEREDPRYFAFFKTALFSGMRQSEILALQWRDVNFSEGIIRVRRSIYQGKISELKSAHSFRQIPLSKSLAKTLKQHKLESIPSPWVFPSEKGTPLNPRNVVRRHFEPALEGAGVKKISFHGLRHSCGAHLVAGGVHPKVIQAILGHSSISTTMNVYGHVMKSEFSHVAETLDRIHKKG